MGIVKIGEVKAVRAYREYYRFGTRSYHLGKVATSPYFNSKPNNLHKEYIKAWFKLLNNK